MASSSAPFPARVSAGEFFSVAEVDRGAAVATLSLRFFAALSSLAESAAAPRGATSAVGVEAGGCSGVSAFDAPGGAGAGSAGCGAAVAGGDCDATCELPEEVCELRH